MGVSGAGKSAVGERLAKRLGWTFLDGDDFHPQSNLQKMSAGIPLNDADRRPWLLAIRRRIDRLEASDTSAIIACSALKKTYRRKLLEETRDTRLVYLRGSRELIGKRLSQRREHFFNPVLMATQFETLEEPDDALVVDVDQTLESVVGEIVRGLGLVSPGGSQEQRD